MNKLVIVLCPEELCEVPPTFSDLPFGLYMVTQSNEYALI